MQNIFRDDTFRTRYARLFQSAPKVQSRFVIALEKDGKTVPDYHLAHLKGFNQQSASVSRWCSCLVDDHQCWWEQRLHGDSFWVASDQECSQGAFIIFVCLGLMWGGGGVRGVVWAFVGFVLLTPRPLCCILENIQHKSQQVHTLMFTSLKNEFVLKCFLYPTSQREGGCPHGPRVPAHERRWLYFCGIQVRESAPAFGVPRAHLTHQPPCLVPTFFPQSTLSGRAGALHSLLLLNPYS